MTRRLRWDEFEAGGRHLGVVGPCDVNPGFFAVGAFLDGREVELARFEGAGEGAAEDELVIPLIGQVAVLPDDFLDAFGQLRAVIVIGLGIGTGNRLQRPARLGHRLHIVEALGNLDADDVGGLGAAAVRNPKHGLVGRADGSLAHFESGMGIGGNGGEGGDGNGRAGDDVDHNDLQ